jgi:hypothetical protein
MPNLQFIKAIETKGEIIMPTVKVAIIMIKNSIYYI